MQNLEVSGAVRHIYMYVIRQLRVNKYFIILLPSRTKDLKSTASFGQHPITVCII